ncbi:MAG: glycosyltransferase [Deltaproteobacteria bacterium]|nr:glycosyltransferase [Deltaproteobacteria bacterium]
MATHKEIPGSDILEQIQDTGTTQHITGQNLIFLISLPRSGSTLLQRILATHQDICTASEPWLMLHPLNALKESDLHAKYDHPLAIGALKDFVNNFPEGDDLYYQAARSYGLTFYRRFLERAGKRLFLDKTPRYYRIIQELKRTFPDARFIILLRNPIAILSSVFKTWCANDISTLTRSSNYRDMIEGPHLLLDGIDALKEKVSVVSYENLVRSPSETIQKLCDFIKIDYVDGMLNYGSHAAPKSCYGDPVTIHQHNRPVKNFLDKWMTNLSDPRLLHFAQEYLQSIGQETINRLGYDFHEIVAGFKSIENKLPIEKNQTISNEVPASVAVTLPGHRDTVDSYEEFVRSLSKDEPTIAIRKLFAFIKTHPDNAMACNDLGVLHYRQNGMKEALEFYRKAAALDPDNNVFKKNLADHLYFTMRKDQEALNIYVKLLKIDPHDTEVLLSVAHLSLANEQVEDARDFCHQILRIHPGNQEAIGLLQLINLARGDRPPLEVDPKTAILNPFNNKPAAAVSSSIPMSTAAFVHPTDDNRSSTPVIIYQMGKVGSTSVMNSLNQMGIPNQHVHRLSWSGITQAEERSQEGGIPEIPDRLIRYREFRNYIETHRHSTRWKVITLVRDPLPRQISCVFQNLNVLLPDVFQMNELSQQCNRIGDYLSNYLSTFDESDDDACNWFDTELKDVFGFDIFSSPFDKKRGYTIYQTKYADILAMRIEQLSDCAGKAFKDFLGIDNFRLVNANASNEKPYYELYKQFLAQFKVPQDLLDKFYDTRLARHFYTSEDIEIFKKRWIPRVSIEFSKQSAPHYRVSAVVSTYKSERFIEGRLQNLMDQTLFKNNEMEVIVVDSNSPENERRIVEQFAGQYPNVAYCRTPERETVYTAWNRGISIARGAYFVNANTDDRFTPDALEIMSDILDTHPDYDATYGNWVVTRTPNDTFESGKSKRLFEYPEFHPGLFFYLQITSHATFVRRSVFEKIGKFDGSYTVFGDREFMFRFSAAGFKALKIDKTVGLYLENPTSVERANKDIGMQECAALYDAYLIPEKFARLIGHDHDVSRKLLSRAYSEAGCFGMGLYQVDGLSVHALGSPTRLFAKAIELDPGNIEALNNMGVIAQYRQAKEDALRFLENAASQANDSQIKTIDHNQKMVNRGVSDPDQLRFLYPSDFQPIKVVEAKYNPNSQNISLGDYKSTYLKSKRSIDKKKQQKKSKEKSLTTPENKKRATPSPLHCGPKVDDKIWPAWGGYLKENHTSAQVALQQILTEHPNHWAAYELLVDVMLQSGQDMDIPDQLRTLENRSDLPDRMLALVGLGYEASGNLEKAAAFADQALAVDAECARAWNLKGVIAYRNGHGSKAAQFFQKASICDHDWGDPWTNMGTLHWENGTHDKALQCFETGFQLSPTAPNVATSYHLAVSETGQYERARKVFEEVVSRHPDFRKGRFLLIDILIRLEDYQVALDQIETVLVRFGSDSQLLGAAKAVRTKVGPLILNNDKHPSLSLCMIVKNEEKYLARCLASLKPVVDEIIIVDTGSTDATRDIAEVFGAQVFDYEWHDDFAAARNHSLEKASGDWILVMDADEVVAASDHSNLLDLMRKSQKAKVGYLITTRNYSHNYNGIGWEANDGIYPDFEAGCGWIPSTKTRLFKNSSKVRFRYPIHELVDPALENNGFNIKQCDVPVHHYGLLDTKNVNRKGRQYHKIGKKKFHKMKNDPQAIKELAVQAGLIGEQRDAIKLWHHFTKLQTTDTRGYINLSAAYCKIGEHKISRSNALKAIKLEPETKEGHLNLGRSEFFLGNYPEACRIFDKLVGMGGTYYSAIFMLGAAQICCGDSYKGIVTLQKLKSLSIWNSLHLSFEELASTLSHAGFDNDAQKLIHCVSRLERVVESGHRPNRQNLTSVNKEVYKSHIADNGKKKIRKRKFIKNNRSASKIKNPASFSSPEDAPSTRDKIGPILADYLKESYSSAQASLYNYLANDPNHWAAYELLVDVMLQSGQDMDIPDQLRTLENRSDLPDRMLALVGLGYEASGNLEKAAAFADQALAVDAECARAWNLKGVIAYRNGHGSKAAQFFQKASICDHDWGDPWTNMGTLHWENGTHDKALQCFETGFQLSPTAPNVATSYHLAVSETGQYERARKVFEEVVSRHPDFRKGRFLLIDILIRLEDYQVALDQIETVLVRFGSDSQLLGAAKAVRTKVGPLILNNDKHPSLSLCMIVKNEEKYLARCLASLKPVVDEIIIVDTGSTDATRDIAEVFGAQVFDYEWHDDFAAARNHSLEKASGDWILVMDADEVVATQDHEKILKLLRKSKSNRLAFMVMTRNYTNQYNIVGWEPNIKQYPKEEAGAGWIPSEKVRLFPSNRAIRFEYPVHEVIGPSLATNNIQIKSCRFNVHHYGKLDEDNERQKDEQYYKIGMEKLSLSQNDPIAIREMAIQAAKLGKHEESTMLWKRLIGIQPNNARGYISLASSYGNLKQYHEAKEASLKAVKIDPNLKEGYLNLGMSELHLGNFAKAEKIFNQIANKDRNFISATILLGSSQLCRGNIEKGIKTLQSLKGKSVWDNLPHSIQNLVESIGAAGWPESSRNLIVGSKMLDCSNDKIKAFGHQIKTEAA